MLRVWVLADGALLIHEQDSAMRARSSELRVLRSNSGLSEARVETLRELVREEREALNKLQLREVLQSDGRCLHSHLFLVASLIEVHSLVVAVAPTASAAVTTAATATAAITAAVAIAAGRWRSCK